MEHCKQEPLSDVESECAELNHGENSAKSQDVPCKEENLDIKDEVQPLPMESSVIKTEPQDVWSEDEEMDAQNEINPMAVVETTNQDDACSEDEEMDVKHKINPMAVVASTMEATNQDADNVCLNGGSDDASMVETVKIESTAHEFVSEENISESSGNNSTGFYICQICEVTFRRPLHLKVHMRMHREIYPNEEEEEEDVKPFAVPIKIEPEDPIVYPCEVCGATFRDESDFEIHMVKHTKSLICRRCGKSFKKKGFLANHLVLCTTKDLYKCHVCKKQLHSRQTYDGHMRLHDGDRTYTCHECDKVFTLHNTLVTHIRNIHENIRPYACHVCNRTYYSKCYLKKHLLIHTGERPFSCHVCGSSFTQQGSVRKHMLLHGIYQYICEFCNKCFKKKKNLTYHHRQVKHTYPYRCEFCNKCYIIQKDFEKHVCVKNAKRKQVEIIIID